jgi:hypothetical protein
MILLNFSHPLTPEQLRQVEEILGRPVERMISAQAGNFDHQKLFSPQVEELIDGLGISSQQWQTEELLVVPPSLNHIAVLVLAELHGRMGYFPAHLRLRPALGSTPPRFEVAEIVDLQKVRERARRKRYRG